MNDINDATNINLLNSKILVVDDEAANVMLLTKILATKGYTNITSTLDPTEVVNLHEEHNFDLILLDINMPTMGGYEVFKQLSSAGNFCDTQVIATSADISENDVKKALDTGFTAYITKPMRMQELLEVVENALQAV